MVVYSYNSINISLQMVNKMDVRVSLSEAKINISHSWRAFLFYFKRITNIFIWIVLERTKLGSIMQFVSQLQKQHAEILDSKDWNVLI